MRLAELVSAYNAQPFRPFRLRLEDGRMFAVPSRYHLAYSGIAQTVTVARTDGADSFSLEQVVALEFDDQVVDDVAGETWRDRPPML